MTISVVEYKRCHLVKMDGRIDGSNGDTLHKVFQDLHEKDIYKIVFDMSDIDFLSSKGWWVLIETQKACKRYNRGEIVLASVPKKISDSLDLVGMSDYFQVFDDSVSAVGNF